MSPGWEKDKDSVCNACECFHARNRVPTVPEKQVARWATKRSIDCKSMWVDTMKQYASMMQGSYRETKSPPCLGGVKRLVNSPSKDGSLLPRTDEVNL
jgi:hypothetical protein